MTEGTPGTDSDHDELVLEPPAPVPTDHAGTSGNHDPGRQGHGQPHPVGGQRLR